MSVEVAEVVDQKYQISKYRSIRYSRIQVSSFTKCRGLGEQLEPSACMQ